MSREAHVRFWERVGVRFPCATRHIVTDTGGLLVGAEVHPADVQDRDGAVLVIEPSTSCFPGYAISSPTVSTPAPTCMKLSPNSASGPSRSG